MKRQAPPWYDILWRLVLPFALLRLWWRGRKEPGYRHAIAQRLGRYPPMSDDRPAIWIHAVSVGETRAAQPLVAAFKQRFPGYRLVLTCMTAAGRATAEALYGDSVTCAWFPYDTSAGARRFLDWCAPRFGVLMETEVWPNAILAARARGVPLFLVNARMSSRSARGYARLAGLTSEVLGALAGIAAQSPGDASRLAALGARNIEVTGNLKFDMPVPDAVVRLGRELRGRFGAARPVWIAGSTRDGEEVMLLDALDNATMPVGSLLVLVPRHPQRFDDVARLLERRAIRFVRRSAGAAVAADIAVVLGDTMGEMLAYYAAADVAFIGGTLLPLGGQNLIEPLAVGTPVVAGPSTFNFSDVTREAVACGAARQVPDAKSAVAEVAALLAERSVREGMQGAAARLLASHRGATGRTLHWIDARLPGATAARD